ncbi:MAG: hypothetical protein ACE5M4_07520 [Anaerolineales bacterium]
MTTNNGTRKSNSSWEFGYNSTNRWVNYITHAVSGAITIVVAAVLTVITIVFVVLAGLWLAYTYLPLNVFTIIVAVLIADIVLGIVLRAFLKRK